MRRVVKPPSWVLQLSAGFFVVAIMEVVAAAFIPGELGYLPLIVAIFLAGQSGKAWSLYWKWRKAYKDYQEWLAK